MNCRIFWIITKADKTDPQCSSHMSTQWLNQPLFLPSHWLRNAKPPVCLVMIARVLFPTIRLSVKILFGSIDWRYYITVITFRWNSNAGVCIPEIGWGCLFEFFLNNITLAMLYNIVQSCIAILSLYSLKYSVPEDISKEICCKK